MLDPPPFSIECLSLSLLYHQTNYYITSFTSNQKYSHPSHHHNHISTTIYHSSQTIHLHLPTITTSQETRERQDLRELRGPQDLVKEEWEQQEFQGPQVCLVALETWVILAPKDLQAFKVALDLGELRDSQDPQDLVEGRDLLVSCSVFDGVKVILSFTKTKPQALLPPTPFSAQPSKIPLPIITISKTPSLQQQHHLHNTTTFTTPPPSQHHHLHNTTTFTTPPSPQHHHLNNTTIPTTPPSQHHHLHNTTTSTTPPLPQHHHPYNTTTFTTPPPPQHHHLHNTTIFTTPLPSQHHHLHNTTTSTTPPSSQHHHLHNTTIPTTPPLPQHHHLHNTTTSTTPPLPQHHLFHNTTTSTTPPSPQHHNLHKTTASTTPPYPRYHLFHYTTCTQVLRV